MNPECTTHAQVFVAGDVCLTQATNTQRVKQLRKNPIQLLKVGCHGHELGPLGELSYRTQHPLCTTVQSLAGKPVQSLMLARVTTYFKYHFY
jgi:hypothetical protein